MKMSTINNIIEKYGADKLNSLTKYPSIMTYHSLGEKGCLTESLVDGIGFYSDDDCYITEKIDGTNARIIFDGEDYVIGSREELLFAKGDRFGNPQLNIVNTAKSIADKLNKPIHGEVCILFGEVYGGNVTPASKQYTTDKTFGFRLFDIASVDINILNEPLERISSWREHGGQKFFNIEMMRSFADEYNIQTVPYLAMVKGCEIPVDRISMQKYLQEFKETHAGINNSGKSEGIVVRTFDRSLIRKVRFEDYERTAKRENWVV